MASLGSYIPKIVPFDLRKEAICRHCNHLYNAQKRINFMIAQPQDQTIALTDPKVKEGQPTTRLMAEVSRLRVYPDGGIVRDSYLVDAVLPDDKTPYGPRLKALINAVLGVDFLLVSYWEHELNEGRDTLQP